MGKKLNVALAIVAITFICSARAERRLEALDNIEQGETTLLQSISHKFAKRNRYTGVRR